LSYASTGGVIYNAFRQIARENYYCRHPNG